MLIGIGSENRSKIAACKKAFTDLSKQFSFNGEDVEILPVNTITSIPDMPLTKNDLMKGALERALFVYNHFQEVNKSVKFAIGMEGGTFKETNTFGHPDQAYLQSWVYAFNGEKGFFGSSPALPLPDSITHALYSEKRELAEVIDDFSGQKDVRSNEGAFGILTRDLITRSQSFYLGIINSMVPFLNEKYYMVNSSQ